MNQQVDVNHQIPSPRKWPHVDQPRISGIGGSERKVCATFDLCRGTLRYPPTSGEQAALRMRVKELAATRPRYGYRRIHILLLRWGWRINHKRVYRIYRQEGLMLRPRTRRRHKTCESRQPQVAPLSPHECWSLDFMSDRLFAGESFRVLTVVDNYSRENLALVAAKGISGHCVAEVLQRLVRERGCPRSIQVDNGPEFTSRILDRWAYPNRVTISFSQPGKPTDNAFIESFNGRFRQERLNQNCFLSLEDAQNKLEKWRRHYNEERRHSALGYLLPTEFAASSDQPWAEAG